MNLSELQREAHAIALSKGWWDEERSFGDLIALVHSELSEALEAYRRNLRRHADATYVNLGTTSGSPARRSYSVLSPPINSMVLPSFITRTKIPTEIRSVPTATVSPEKAVINAAVSDIRYLS